MIPYHVFCSALYPGLALYASNAPSGITSFRLSTTPFANFNSPAEILNDGGVAPNSSVFNAPKYLNASSSSSVTAGSFTVSVVLLLILPNNGSFTTFNDGRFNSANPFTRFKAVVCISSRPGASKLIKLLHIPNAFIPIPFTFFPRYTFSMLYPGYDA